MSDTVIKVENLSKKYVISHQAERGRNGTLRDALASMGRSVFGRLLGASGSGPQTKEEFWALKDVSFEVKRGEVVGIIGRNGAGKSTLLKILSRITEPTTGRITIDGRVASLLEVGTGFHGELSGRENIFLNGAILGMSQAEIKRKFDEIVAFAEIEKFLDTPVKRYSSGMYMRLAFAVAAHLEPEILIVDEVLAVGDAAFQKKCIGKMADVAKGGRTILFVSHNLQAVSALCTSAVVLQRGVLVHLGSVDIAMDLYSTDLLAKQSYHWNGFEGDEELALLSLRVDGKGSNEFIPSDEAIRVRITFRTSKVLLGVVCALEVMNSKSNRIVYTNFDDLLPPPSQEYPVGVHSWELEIPSNTFAAGDYLFEVDLGIHNVRRVTKGNSSVKIRIENISGIGRRQLAHSGVVRPDWVWKHLATAGLEASVEEQVVGSGTDVQEGRV